MEKVKFGTGTYEHELVPVGITVNDANKTRSIRFISTLSYNDVINIVSNPDNFATITVIGQDGNPTNTFVDCVAFKGLAFDKGVNIGDNATADVFTVTYSVDAIEKMLVGLNEQLTENKTRIDATFAAVDFILTNF